MKLNFKGVYNFIRMKKKKNEKSHFKFDMNFMTI